MLKLNTSTKFKKDYKLCQKRGSNLSLLQDAVNTLRIPTPLPPKNKDHNLSGKYSGCRECHIMPDWLLIYHVTVDELYLVRTGSHADLFNM
ncbi:MAG TPA: type II toxin-antitoxin system mRNA interferase toxin, RelE/StbE family [Lachnospiraceae bacterium]|jgi:mRNA interferase YafQ|nr:type II toxin-antitoxin system mRNA interferase toxin, RelE/StbE family [Lachnospiraceae bacterium]